MAVLSLSDDFNRLSFEQIAQIPRDIQADMLAAEGEVLKKAQANLAQQQLKGKYSTGTTARASSTKKPDVSGAGGSIVVTFDGTRARKTPTQNAEIAYLNNYGVKGKNRATHFVDRANEQSADKIAEAGASVLFGWMDSQL